MYDDHLDTGRLTPGVVDEAAIDLFERGGCIAMAVALHELTGWDILAVTDSHNVMDGVLCMGSSLHWGVRSPDGKFVDVAGEHEFEDMIERFEDEADDGEAAIGKGTRADAEDWLEESAAGRVKPAAARPFAETVLANLRARDARP